MQVDTKRVIFVPSGSQNFIISYLNKSHYELNILDNLVLRVLGHPQKGWIDLKSTKMTKLDFLYKLTTSKAALKQITIIPGETYYFYLQDIAKELNISTYKLFLAYSNNLYKKDGDILANTYYLPLGMDEEQLIKYLFDLTQKKYMNLSKKIFGTYDKKQWYTYITIASIIQKEAANKKEMPLVSSVIYNRIKKNMPLQMDGTLNYSKYSHTKVTPSMIKEDTSDYNTYKNKGIPSDPICAVEIEAIKSAIFPANSDYLYFMKNADSTKHIFSSSYKEHINTIRNVKKQIHIQKKQEIKKDKENKTTTPKDTTNLKTLWK